MKYLELQVSLELLKAIEKNEINSKSPMTIIAKGIEIVDLFWDPSAGGFDKKTLLIKSLEKLAAGKDGVLGTADDILPESTLLEIKRLIDSNLIEDIISTLIDVSKGKFDINQITKTTCNLLQCLFPNIKKSKIFLLKNNAV